MADVLATEPDEALLDRLTRKDPAALEALYARYGRMAFALAYRMLGSPEAAEDAVQEAFLSVWRAADTYRQTRGAARGWLLSVVRNRAIDMIRARESRPKVSATLDDIGTLAAESSDPAAEALKRIEAVKVREALTSLPREQRETVELAFFAGLSYPEVAARMGAPLGTVKSRLRLAMERLRGLLLAEDALG